MQEADVVIIGAGMAGVSAADALRDTGLKTMVLEGNAHRIGGRILSSGHWPDAHIDLGASWITHELFNPLVKVAADNHIEIAPSELLDLSLRTADGRKMAEEEIEQLFALFLDMYAEVKLNAESYREEGKADPPASEEWQRVLADRHLSPEVENGIRFFMNFAIEEPNKSSLTDLSLYNWDDDSIFLQVAMGVFPKGSVSSSTSSQKGSTSGWIIWCARSPIPAPTSPFRRPGTGTSTRRRPSSRCRMPFSGGRMSSSSRSCRHGSAARSTGFTRASPTSSIPVRARLLG